MKVKALMSMGLAAVIGMLSGVTGRAQAPAVELKVGDAAPAFSLPGSDGKTHSLADSKGKAAVVLAWFPKAFTGG
jgi:thioredoxin-dependent peroxiredoxin